MTGIGQSVAFALSDAIVRYAGYKDGEIDTLSQDEVLSDSTLAARFARSAYVCDQCRNCVPQLTRVLQVIYQALVAPSTLIDETKHPQDAIYNIQTYRLAAKYVVLIHVALPAAPHPLGH